MQTTACQKVMKAMARNKWRFPYPAEYDKPPESDERYAAAWRAGYADGYDCRPFNRNADFVMVYDRGYGRGLEAIKSELALK